VNVIDNPDSTLPLTKMCSGCKTIKPLDDYYTDKSGKYNKSYACKSCAKRRSKIYKNIPINRERQNAIRAVRRKDKDPKIARKYELFSKYGITLSQYDEMFNKQNGRCAICGLTSKANLSVDHNHSTGTVRGLLCNNCNRGIGYLKDSIELLASANSYLLFHERGV